MAIKNSGFSYLEIWLILIHSRFVDWMGLVVLLNILIIISSFFDNSLVIFIKVFSAPPINGEFKLEFKYTKKIIQAQATPDRNIIAR